MLSGDAQRNVLTVPITAHFSYIFALMVDPL